MSFDLIAVGGGLQGGLLALAALHHRPSCRIALVEREAGLGGNHTWCFHDGDVPPEARSWVEPLVVERWAGHDVAFPGLRRTLGRPYFAVTSERLAEVVARRLSGGRGCLLSTGLEAVEIGSSRVRLTNGRELEGRVVVDARGPEPIQAGQRAAYQKFVGLEVELDRPARLDRPLLMDATVEQRDGFRFLYLLPLAGGRLLAEETRFSPSPRLDPNELREGTLAYLDDRGLGPARVVRQEQGVLPMPWERRHRAPDRAGPLVAGFRGGFFHPGTGYSFGPAARLAHVVASGPHGPALDGRVLAFAAGHERQARFARLLNRMLFLGWPPGSWWRVFRWFHRLGEERIGRFYALETTAVDRAAILLGVPPRGMSVAAMVRG